MVLEPKAPTQLNILRSLGRNRSKMMKFAPVASWYCSSTGENILKVWRHTNPKTSDHGIDGVTSSHAKKNDASIELFVIKIARVSIYNLQFTIYTLLFPLISLNYP